MESIMGWWDFFSVWNGVLAEEPKAVTFLWQNFYQCELFMVFSQQPGVPCPENSSPGVSIQQILRIWFPGKYRISIEWWLLELGEDLESEEKRRVEKVLSLPDFPGKLKTGISRDPNRAPLVLQEPRRCWLLLVCLHWGHIQALLFPEAVDAASASRSCAEVRGTCRKMSPTCQDRCGI